MFLVLLSQNGYLYLLDLSFLLPSPPLDAFFFRFLFLSAHLFDSMFYSFQFYLFFSLPRSLSL